MDFQELQHKIDHARNLETSLSSLPFEDIKELLEARSEDSTNYLSYIDGEGEEVTISYTEFYQHVLGCARFLQHHGLSRGDRIATIAHNHWHTVVQYFAAWMLGLVVVPVNLEEDDERIAYILENGQIELAFVRTEYRDRFRGVLERYDQLKHIEWIVCEGKISNFTTSDVTLNLEDISLSESDALIVYTSGTTGKPKGVVLTQRNLLEDARAIARWHNINKKTRMMCVLPIHHVNGMVVTLVTPFWAGGAVVLNRQFKVSRFFSLVRDRQVHIVSMVPTLLQYLNNFYREKDPPLTNPLHHIICGAGPLTVDIAQTFEKRFGVPIIHGYGLSEATCYSCFVPVDITGEKRSFWHSHYGYPSIGSPVSANDMAIHDSEGNALTEEERGEIVIRGVNVMRGYYNDKDANEQAFINGWFRSGDEGFYVNDKEEGRPYFFITGRLKETIIRGGVNISPLEIDEIINRAPGVKAGIAVGFENDWYGEEVGAYVQLKEGTEDTDAVLDYCRQHLPFSKSPKVVVVGDQLPVTSTGKYQRNKVKDRFIKWKSIQFRK